MNIIYKGLVACFVSGYFLFANAVYAIPHKNIFIFDWDDTLYTTHCDNPKTCPKDIRSLEIAVSKILSRSLERGDVFIVTNAQKAWVTQRVFARFPSLVPLFGRIKIISAREYFVAREAKAIQEILNFSKPSFNSKLSFNKKPDLYQPEKAGDSLFDEMTDPKGLPPILPQTNNPRHIQRWKYSTFQQLMLKYLAKEPKDVFLNFISIGDSDYERSAVLNALPFELRIGRKSILLHPLPTLNQIVKELEVVEQALAPFVSPENITKTIDLQVQITMHASSSSSSTNPPSDSLLSDSSLSPPPSPNSLSLSQSPEATQISQESLPEGAAAFASLEAAIQLSQLKETFLNESSSESSSKSSDDSASEIDGLSDLEL